MATHQHRVPRLRAARGRGPASGDPVRPRPRAGPGGDHRGDAEVGRDPRRRPVAVPGPPGDGHLLDPRGGRAAPDRRLRGRPAGTARVHRGAPVRPGRGPEPAVDRPGPGGGPLAHLHGRLDQHRDRPGPSGQLRLLLHQARAGPAPVAGLPAQPGVRPARRPAQQARVPDGGRAQPAHGPGPGAGLAGLRAGVARGAPGGVAVAGRAAARERPGGRALGVVPVAVHHPVPGPRGRGGPDRGAEHPSGAVEPHRRVELDLRHDPVPGHPGLPLDRQPSHGASRAAAGGAGGDHGPAGVARDQDRRLGDPAVRPHHPGPGGRHHRLGQPGPAVRHRAGEAPAGAGGPGEEHGLLRPGPVPEGAVARRQPPDPRRHPPGLDPHLRAGGRVEPPVRPLLRARVPVVRGDLPRLPDRE
ncbi:hypothetical protein HRbin32_02012 [bacterium HR32]|nr:hypothetical protein HRbin32_02012 [bacterium HR32]